MYSTRFGRLCQCKSNGAVPNKGAVAVTVRRGVRILLIALRSPLCSTSLAHPDPADRCTLVVEATPVKSCVGCVCKKQCMPLAGNKAALAWRASEPTLQTQHQTHARTGVWPNCQCRMALAV